MSNTLVITAEGVSTALIGAYGWSQASTPAIDEMAATGLLLDNCFLDAVGATENLRSLWTGRHHLQSSTDWSLWHQTESSGGGALLTDCPKAAELAASLGCPEVNLITPPDNGAPCDAISDCGMMPLFAAVAEELATGLAGLVWVHSRALRLPWDAPHELRMRLTDPGDPAPPDQVGPPVLRVESSTDPDLVVGWNQVAGAQVSVLDEAIDALRQTVAARDDARSWNQLLVSLGGVPLGEHGQVGWLEQEGSDGRPCADDSELAVGGEQSSSLIGSDSKASRAGQPTTLDVQSMPQQSVQLHSMQLHCAVVVCGAAGGPVVPGLRRAELCQLPDLTAVLLELCAREPASHDGNSLDPEMWGSSLLREPPKATTKDWASKHQLAMVQRVIAQPASRETWIRSPAWSASLREDQASLYTKPDDCWEFSDIASRRPDIVAQLREAVGSYEAALEANRRDSLPTLPDELCDLLR